MWGKHSTDVKHSVYTTEMKKALLYVLVSLFFIPTLSFAATSTCFEMKSFPDSNTNGIYSLYPTGNPYDGTAMYTNASGYYSFSEAYDPSKEYYIQFDLPNLVQLLTNTDGLGVANNILGKTTRNGLTYHVFDLNNDPEFKAMEEEVI